MPGVPPHGTGFLPARNPLELLRNAAGRAALDRIHVLNGLLPLNRSWALLGLRPLHSPFEQHDAAARVLVLVNSAFDFPAQRLPSNIRYVGTPFDDVGTVLWELPWPPGDARPLVVVSLSTVPQGQGPLMHRVLHALAMLSVRALVTLGPVLDRSQFSAPENVRLETFVPHAAVLPHAAAMVTQGGLGGLTKALAHGAPLVEPPSRTSPSVNGSSRARVLKEVRAV